LKITSFNKNYGDYIKLLFDHNLSTGENITDIHSKVKNQINIGFWVNKYKDIFKNKKDNKVDFFEIKDTSYKGKTYYREIFLHPIRNSKGEIAEIAIIGQNTTERRLAEQKIIEQSAKLQAIFESGAQLFWTVDKNYFFTSFNQNFSDAMFNVYKVKPSVRQKNIQPSKNESR
jgi:PAS domain-containing protein